jgi:hypothetical protein
VNGLGRFGGFADELGKPLFGVSDLPGHLLCLSYIYILVK